MSFKVPEQYRDTMVSSHIDGNNGLFFINHWSRSRDDLKIIASDGEGWEHVSVSKKYECPTWEEMCKVKELFWGDEDIVVQYHPPKSQYVNCHPFCLHLWRPINQQIPIPPPMLIGILTGVR